MAEQTKRTRAAGQHSNTHTHQGNKAVSTKDNHAHIADEEETYDKIVGSLGDVNDEGCLDLDGVRFIVNDVAYSGQDEQADYSELLKAMVLGDIFNTPRFKNNFRKR